MVHIKKKKKKKTLKKKHVEETATSRDYYHCLLPPLSSPHKTKILLISLCKIIDGGRGVGENCAGLSSLEKNCFKLSF